MRTNEELVCAFQQGEREALTELWENNLKGVRLIAERLAEYGLGEAEDLMQEGFLGLLHAAEKYEPDLVGGVKFITYAWPWIQQAMVRYIENCERSIRVPSWITSKVRKMKRYRSQYEKLNGKLPSDSELCRYMRINPGQLHLLQVAEEREKVRSIDEKMPGDDDRTIEETLSSDDNVEDQAIREADREQLAALMTELMEKLPDDQKQALYAHYWAQVPISDEVRNASKRGLRSLCAPHMKKKLRPYYEAYFYAGRRVSVGEFNRTHMSEVEWAVIKAEEARERNEDLHREDKGADCTEQADL